MLGVFEFEVTYLINKINYINTDFCMNILIFLDSLGVKPSDRRFIFGPIYYLYDIQFKILSLFHDL